MSRTVRDQTGVLWTVSQGGATGGGATGGPGYPLPPLTTAVFQIEGSDGRTAAASLPIGDFEKLSDEEVLAFVRHALARKGSR